MAIEPARSAVPSQVQDTAWATIALVRCLQLADSALPIGRYVQSFGLEALLADDPKLNPDRLKDVVESFLEMSVSRLDAVAIAEAHRLASRGDVAALVSLDRALTVRKLSPASRRASLSCGGQLAVLALSLVSNPTLGPYFHATRSGAADGNLAVVEGAFGAALGLPASWAVIIELRGSAAGLLSAAVRLGRLSANRAQQLLLDCEQAISRAATEALSCAWPETSSSAIELEIYGMRHARADSRLFMT